MQTYPAVPEGAALGSTSEPVDRGETTQVQPSSPRAAAHHPSGGPPHQGTDLQPAGGGIRTPTAHSQRPTPKPNASEAEDPHTACVCETPKSRHRGTDPSLYQRRGDQRRRGASVNALPPALRADPRRSLPGSPVRKSLPSPRTTVTRLAEERPAMEETLTCNRSPFSQVFGRQGQLMQASE
ncbi:unnamed protein product [Arctogadus glacialis]